MAISRAVFRTIVFRPLSVVPVRRSVQYGHAIPDVAGNAQKAVSSAVEAMTGCAVEAVNIHVGGVTLN